MKIQKYWHWSYSQTLVFLVKVSHRIVTLCRSCSDWDLFSNWQFLWKQTFHIQEVSSHFDKYNMRNFLPQTGHLYDEKKALAWLHEVWSCNKIYFKWNSQKTCRKICALWFYQEMCTKQFYHCALFQCLINLRIYLTLTQTIFPYCVLPF